jgi:hypothetical protein
MVDGQPTQQFVGKEVICGVRNNTNQCLNAAWNYNRAGPQLTVDNWSVVSYFAGFTAQHRLPTTAIDDIELVMEDEDIFLNLAPHD